MNSIIDKFYWAWNDVEKIKELSADIVNNYSDHLRNGTWKILWSDKAFLVRTPSKGLLFYRKYFERIKNKSPWWTIMKAHMQNILSANQIYCCKDDHSHVFFADCLMLSKNGTVNFYDLEKMIIKKQYDKSCSEGYYKLKNVGYWDLFRTPVISIHDNTAIERIIISRNKVNDNVQYFKLIEKKYIEYFCMIKPVVRHCIAEMVTPYKNLIPFFDKIFTDAVIDLELNFYVMHGDFHNDNVLIDKSGKIYVIDYELAGYHPFFQDLLWFATKKVDSGKKDWSIADALMDPQTEIGRLFNNVLISQGIPTNKTIKLVLFVLTRLWYYNQVVKLEQWTDRKMDKFYYSREKNVISDLIERYMHF